MKFISKLIVPLLILIIAAVQFRNVSKRHLTTWKGGGFGMYADIHWNFREIWFFGLPEQINPLDGFYFEASCVRQYPTHDNMLELGEKVRQKHKITQPFSMEVWEPRYRNGVLSRALLNKTDVR